MADLLGEYQQGSQGDRQKQELRQHRKGQGNEVQLYGTQERNDALLLQDHLLKSSKMQAEITKLNRKNEQLHTAIAELQRVNDQFSTTNLDVDTQVHDFKTNNVNLQKRNAKMQSTVADLIKKNYRMWSHVSEMQESITDLKTAVDEVKEDNSKLQSMISELHLKNEQLHSITVELQGNISPVEASAQEKLCKLAVAGTEDQELNLRILKLQEQNDQLKTMIMDLDKKQDCQGTLKLQMQDNVTQVQDIMEKLHNENKQMQNIISELDEKKYQLEVFVSALQENNFKLQAAIPHNGQLLAFSEVQNNMREENLKLQHENWELQATISQLCKNKHQLETSLSTLKEKVCKLEADEFDSKKLQFMNLELQDKINECTTTIIKLEDKNINLQKSYSDLQDYKNEQLIIVSELQSKALKLEGAELQSRELQLLVTDLQEKNAQLKIKINQLAKKNNCPEEYLSQVQQNVTHHWIANVDLQENARPQSIIMETKKMKYPFETSSSELQAVLHILEVTGTIKERLQISASQMQENIFVAQVNILKLHGRINCLHKIVMELQENSHQFSLNISELQDKIYKPDIRKSQNQHLLLICQEKKNYSEERVSIPEFETMVESPITWLPPSRGRSLVQVILKVIMISQEIKISIENIGIETNHLQASFFDLESKVSKIQLHKDGLLNTEDCTLQELVQQLTEYKCTLEKREEEKALLKQKVFELDKRLVEEKLFSNKIEAQIQNQQRVANSEISKLQKSVKDLLSSNMKLEETINWSLERNGVLGVKLATLKNILAEEQFQFSEKEAKTNHQWQVYINQVESLQGILSEMFTENTDLKETIKILDQEKVQLQTTVQGSELQSKLKSEKLNVEIQQDDQLGAKCSGNSLQEKSKTMQKNNIKLIRGMEKLEVGKQLPENTVNKLETKVTKENLCCDEKSTQMKSQWKTTDCDANNCPETTTEKLLDNTNKACETLVTIEKAETMIDLVNSEIKVELTDKMLGCIGNEIPDMINQSTLAVFKNTHLFEMPTELMESNKQLQAYIENLMEEKCLLAAMVSELEKKVREIQQHVDENEVQKKNTFCEGIPTISIPQESECKQLFDHKNVFMFQDEENHFQDAMVAEQEKKFAREEFHSSELAVQMEIQKKAYVAENKSLQNIIKDVQEKNEELKETVKNHEEEKKSLETRLVELESILCMDQLHGCEIQAQQKYQIMLLENQKCQLEDMVDDLLDENGTLDVDVDKSLLQITEDETGSDLKEQHCFSELKAKNDVEPAGKVCETTKLQGETKELEERSRRYKLIVEKYRVEKEFLAESLSKCKNLFKKQLIYYRESVADLTNQLKEANIKVQQLQEKLNTHNNAKLQEIINKSGEEIFFPHGSSVCHSEGQCRKSMPMGPEHHTSNITNPDNPRQQPQNCPESKKYLKLHVQLPEEKNDSKTLDLKKNQQQETIKELENSSEQIQKAMENIEREKKMLELNVTQLKKMLDFEQYTSNKLKVYLKNKCKILADQNNDLQEMITELWDDNITFQVSIDNLEKENKLLKFKITELKNEMKMNQECCIDKAVQKDIPKPIDLQSKLQRPENSNLNFQTTIAKLCRDRILPEVVVSNFEKKNECLNYQLKEVDIENNHIHKAGKELQDSNAKLQDTIVKTEHNNILLIETSGNLQDNVIEEDNLSIVLLNNSQTVVAYSENSIQQELKKNSSENPHLLIESLAEEKLEFRDSQINNEPKEENLYVSKNVFQPDSQKDFTWAIQERKRIDVAVENLSGEISFPEVSIIKLEKPISEDQLHPQGTERSTIDSSHQHKTRTEAINNIQDIVTDRHRQVKEKKEFSAAALIIDEQDHCTSKAASQSDILWNSADTEVRNNYLQGTTESLDNMKDLEIIQIVKMKKETVLAADSKLQEKVEEEPWDAEKAAPVCADQAPVIDPESIDQLEKAVTPLKRIREANGITLNHQEEKELQKITHSDRETELSEEEFKDISHINQSLSVNPVPVFCELNESTPPDTEQLTENSEPQKDNRKVTAAVKKQDIDLVLKMKPALLEDDSNSLDSLKSEEITAQEMKEKETNRSTPPTWMKCMIQ